MKSANHRTPFPVRVKKHDYLLIAAVILLATSLFMKGHRADIHFADTYFVMETEQLLTILGFYLTLVSLLYFFTSNLLYTRLLSWAHIVVNIICCFSIPAVLLIYPESSFTHTMQANRIQVLLLSTVVVTQLFYVVNFLLGLLTYRRAHS